MPLRPSRGPTEQQPLSWPVAKEEAEAEQQRRDEEEQRADQIGAHLIGTEKSFVNSSKAETRRVTSIFQVPGTLSRASGIV